MNNRSFYNPSPLQRRTERRALPPLLRLATCLFLLIGMPRFAHGFDAPQWMHALAPTRLPSYDDKTNAVLLFSERSVTVMSADKIKTQVREAYKILRPQGRDRGTVAVATSPLRKLKSLHGWCIPAQGKDYEVREKDAIEISSTGGGM